VLSLALVCSAEIAAVRRAELWPRAIDRDRPTPADARALALLAREQERTAADRIESWLVAPDETTVPTGRGRSGPPRLPAPPGRRAGAGRPPPPAR
jgi:membrane protein